MNAKRNCTFLDFNILPIFRIIQYKHLIPKCSLDIDLKKLKTNVRSFLLNK